MPPCRLGALLWGPGPLGGAYPPAHRPLTARSSLRELQTAPDAIPESGVEPPPLDTAWVEATRKKALLKLEKLDTDLKNYKGNSIKESIRCRPGVGKQGREGRAVPDPRPLMAVPAGAATMTWVTTILTVGTSAMPSNVTPVPETTAPAPSTSSTCASTSLRWVPAAGGAVAWRDCRAALLWARRGRPTLSAPCLPAQQVSVYLQNWSHVLSYVSKAESTPEIAEVAAHLRPCPGSPCSPGGPHPP